MWLNFIQKLLHLTEIRAKTENDVPKQKGKSDEMVTIHSIEEILTFYISLGGLQKDTANGFCYIPWNLSPPAWFEDGMKLHPSVYIFARGQIIPVSQKS